MSNDTFNMSMRKFLKQVGVTSQQAIEEHVRREGLTSGSLKAKMTLTFEGSDFVHEVDGKIDLD
ncbi:DUF6494 family protein [Roseibium sp.]|uniref:DUF6494 family protein n=1 Tax=Roseibium sp. TaxID=1936156 RepID=UPI003A97494D